MAGPLKTLFGALVASPFITANSVTMVFGNEEVNTQRFAMPYVVMVPIGGPFVEPGYAQGTDPYVETLWETAETIEFWLFNASTAGGAAQGAVDHADAIETLRQLLLSALRDQRAQYTDFNNVAYGLQTRVISGRWEVMTNAVSRFSRAYVLSVMVAISIAQAVPPEATITSELVNAPTILHGAP